MQPADPNNQTEALPGELLGQIEFFISAPSFRRSDITMNIIIPVAYRDVALNLVDMAGLMVVGRLYKKEISIGEEGLLTEAEIHHWYAQNVVQLGDGTKMVKKNMAGWVVDHDDDEDDDDSPTPTPDITLPPSLNLVPRISE